MIILRSLLRSGLRRLALFRSARRAPVICSPALLRRPGEQITSARFATLTSPDTGVSFSGRFAPSSRRVAAFCAPLRLNLICPAQAPAKSDSASAPDFSFSFRPNGMARRCRLGLLPLPSGDFPTSASSSRKISSSPLPQPGLCSKLGSSRVSRASLCTLRSIRTGALCREQQTGESSHSDGFSLLIGLNSTVLGNRIFHCGLKNSCRRKVQCITGRKERPSKVLHCAESFRITIVKLYCGDKNSIR